jgi:hypothetical protein
VHGSYLFHLLHPATSHTGSVPCTSGSGQSRTQLLHIVGCSTMASMGWINSLTELETSKHQDAGIFWCLLTAMISVFVFGCVLGITELVEGRCRSRTGSSSTCSIGPSVSRLFCC